MEIKYLRISRANGSLIKIFIVFPTLLIFHSNLYCQMPKKGYWESASGRSSISIVQVGNDEFRTGRGDVNTRVEGNLFLKTHLWDGVSKTPFNKYKVYTKIISPTHIILFDDDKSTDDTSFYWQSDEISYSEADDDCKEKATFYNEKATEAQKNGPMEGFSYLGCSTLAMQLCTVASEDIRIQLIKKYAKNLRQMDSSIKCPCPDVIPQEVWEAN